MARHIQLKDLMMKRKVLVFTGNQCYYGMVDIREEEFMNKNYIAYFESLGLEVKGNLATGAYKILLLGHIKDLMLHFT